MADINILDISGKLIEIINFDNYFNIFNIIEKNKDIIYYELIIDNIILTQKNINILENYKTNNYILINLVNINIDYNNIIDFINKYHDQSLVKYNVSPNSNHIIHLYNDGEITEQKGGNVYLDRSERIIQYSLNINLDANRFAKKIYDSNRNIKNGYIITTQENAIKLRNIMKELINKPLS